MPLTLEGTIRRTFIPTGDVADRRLVSPLKTADPAQAFKELAGQLASLEAKAEAAIATAIHLHYGAVLLFDRDLAAAYTLIVAAIETLSQEFGEPPSDWAAWEKADSWEKFIGRNNLSTEQGEALRAELMKDRHLRLKQTFVNYVTTRLPSEFWSTEWEPYLYTVDATAGVWREGAWHEPKEMRSFLPEDRDRLARCLRKSYDARSSFVHTGKRVVNVSAQLRDLIMPASGDHPLAFAVLRSILTTLVSVELKRNASHFEVPDIVLKHE